MPCRFAQHCRSHAECKAHYHKCLSHSKGARACTFESMSQDLDESKISSACNVCCPSACGGCQLVCSSQAASMGTHRAAASTCHCQIADSEMIVQCTRHTSLASRQGPSALLTMASVVARTGLARHAASTAASACRRNSVAASTSIASAFRKLRSL